jgi:hypothetical protein
MAAMTNYLENALVNAVFRNTTYTSPATVYVGLFTSDPTDAMSGTEITGAGGYARQVVTFGAPSNGAISNTGALTFGPASGATWGSITHMAIFDAVSGGNGLVHGSLATPKTVDVGDSLVFAIGDVDVTFQ